MSNGNVHKATTQEAQAAFARIEAGQGSPDDYSAVRAALMLLRIVERQLQLGQDEPDSVSGAE